MGFFFLLFLQFSSFLGWLINAQEYWCISHEAMHEKNGDAIWCRKLTSLLHRPCHYFVLIFSMVAASCTFRLCSETRNGEAHLFKALDWLKVLQTPKTSLCSFPFPSSSFSVGLGVMRVGKTKWWVYSTKQLRAQVSHTSSTETQARQEEPMLWGEEERFIVKKSRLILKLILQRAEPAASLDLCLIKVQVLRLSCLKMLVTFLPPPQAN